MKTMQTNPGTRFFSLLQKGKLLDGKIKRTANDATSDGTYVWLPIKWKKGTPHIYWKEEWKLSDFQ